MTLQLITCQYYFIFQTTILGITGLFAVLVPDVPFSVKTQILRENLLAREAIYETDINDDKVSVYKQIILSISVAVISVHFEISFKFL